jgi:hypothetical protein
LIFLLATISIKQKKKEKKQLNQNKKMPQLLTAIKNHHLI